MTDAFLMTSTTKGNRELLRVFYMTLYDFSHMTPSHMTLAVHSPLRGKCTYALKNWAQGKNDEIPDNLTKFVEEGRM